MNITPIIDHPIEDIISKYVSLKRKGTSLTSQCPFHKEKSASFHVSASKNIFKCFGCGVGGNSITFVMKHLGINFIDACKKIADDHKLNIDLTPQTEEDKQLHDKRESLLVAMDFAAKYYNKLLYEESNALALEYALSRWSKEQIEEWRIGFAPDSWTTLLDASKEAKINEQYFVESGMLALSDKKKTLYDVFRNRIMIPIFDRYNRVISFSGRIMPGADDKQAKYINGSETILYKKSNVLFGLNFASRRIKEKGFTFLVEGNPDVIKLHKLDKLNTVAPCGTALADEQIDILKDLCKSVTIIGDGDKAGLEAMIKNGRRLIEKGLFCNVIELPILKKKVDPDTFFNDEEEFNNYTSENNKDYILWYADRELPKCQNPDYKLKVIKDLVPLIAKLDKASHVLLIDKLSANIKPKKAWTDELKLHLQGEVKEEPKQRIPKHVKLSDFERYGFYDDGNCYFFKTAKGIVQGSNFTLRPLFHIDSVTNSKRLFEITNEFHFTKLIELDQKDLISLSGFQLKVESIGNFIWMGGITELIKLKSFLYAETLTAKMVEQLGWNKDGFFSWSNGIYNSTFTPIDDMGIVTHNEKHYYIPAKSKIYESEENLFMAEKKFKFLPGKIQFEEYTRRICEVFGQNAMFAFCYLLASINRDIIMSHFDFFPMLNLFGFKGSGKTVLGESLLHFFGPDQKGINLPSSTEPAMADYVSQNKNAIALLDEYKNNFEPSKIEFLKGLWKGIGRNRMNMDKDKKKEETKVDSGVIISGQEMPTADVALFSRLVYLTFYKCEFTEKEVEVFEELKSIEKQGLGHLTHEILSHRQYFKENFLNSYNKATDDLREALGEIVIEGRILNNWLVIIASFLTLKDKIKTSYNYIELCSLAVNQIKLQNAETKTSNEIATFWRIIQYLDADGLIHESADYKIKTVTEFKTDSSSYDWSEPTNVLIVQHSRIIPLYRKAGRAMGENILPSDSIDYYLKNDNRFIGRKNSESFHKCDPKTGTRLYDAQGNKLRKVNSAYCFLYDKLNITLSNSENEDDSVTKPF